jgi:hypothetical protein
MIKKDPDRSYRCVGKLSESLVPGVERRYGKEDLLHETILDQDNLIYKLLNCGVLPGLTSQRSLIGFYERKGIYTICH